MVNPLYPGENAFEVLNDVLLSGVIRYRPGAGVSTKSRITMAQAQQLADDWTFEYKTRLYFDIGAPFEPQLDHTSFDPPVKAAAIRNWVNKHFGADGRPLPQYLKAA